MLTLNHFVGFFLLWVKFYKKDIQNKKVIEHKVTELWLRYKKKLCPFGNTSKLQNKMIKTWLFDAILKTIWTQKSATALIVSKFYRKKKILAYLEV